MGSGAFGLVWSTTIITLNFSFYYPCLFSSKYPSLRNSVPANGLRPKLLISEEGQEMGKRKSNWQKVKNRK